MFWRLQRMPALNVLLIASADSAVLDLLFKSKYLNKLYTNFELPNVPDIRFNTFKELAEKCKALKIDLVLVDDKKFILQGIADVLRVNYINCFAINSFWTQLILSNSFARNMAEKYGIDTPKIMKYPQEYPLVVRADGFKETAGSLQDIIDISKTIVNHSQEIANTIYLEQFIDGKKTTLISFFDGKNLITCSNEEIPENIVEDYNSKLKRMFVSENSDFIGYINSEVILKEQTLFNLGFNLEFPTVKEDLLYILISAIYQKLDEITL